MATVVRKKIVKEAGQPVDELEEQVAQVRERMGAAGGGAVVD
jgi:polyhydroxyalkanoate synthesis regulator phasin